jgi:hypothetical protein
MKLALAALVACGCGVLLPANGPPTTAPLVAEMERFGCLGAWPSWEIKVYANGIVQYEGIAYVRVLGKRTTDIGPAGVELLRRHLDRSGFFTQDHNFTTGDEDVCGISWIEYRGFRANFEAAYEPTPFELFDLAYEFDRLTNSKQWTDYEAP